MPFSNKDKNYRIKKMTLRKISQDSSKNLINLLILLTPTTKLPNLKLSLRLSKKISINSGRILAKSTQILMKKLRSTRFNKKKSSGLDGPLKFKKKRGNNGRKKKLKGRNRKTEKKLTKSRTNSQGKQMSRKMAKKPKRKKKMRNPLKEKKSTGIKRKLMPVHILLTTVGVSTPQRSKIKRTKKRKMSISALR